ncbi:hypothetical protein [Gemmatimonas sp.]|uniref:hypothetical protein n=1 Tax=Gemmatimonas sp. TaxID=1962908 RepID=UPI0031BF9F1E|nr:hypothetical protein [Gemmatimonas sp.]
MLLVGLIAAEAGFFARGFLGEDRPRSVREVFAAGMPRGGTSPTMYALLVLGEDDCRGVITALELLDAQSYAHSGLRRTVWVQGSNEALMRTVAAVKNLGLDAFVRRVGPSELQAVGVAPGPHIGRLLLLNRQLRPIFLSMTPASPAEYATLVRFTGDLIDKEFSRP